MVKMSKDVCFSCWLKVGLILIILLCFAQAGSALIHVPLVVTITANPPTINPGSPLTITGSVTSSGYPLSGARVSYTINGGSITSAGYTDSAGGYDFTVTSYPEGSFLVEVLIEKDDVDVIYSGSNSVKITVNPASTTTSVSSGTNPSTYGQSVTFKATVSSNGGAIPNGETVTFKDGSTTLGTGTTSSGSATFSTPSPLGVGSHTITAVYAGDFNFISSTSSPLTQTVNPASTTTSVSSDTNPSTYGQSATFIVTVSSSGGAIPNGEAVTFKDGSTILGTGTTSSGSATFSTSSPLGVGSHTITAVYAGDTNFSTSTGTLSGGQTVNPASIPTTPAPTTPVPTTPPPTTPVPTTPPPTTPVPTTPPPTTPVPTPTPAIPTSIPWWSILILIIILVLAAIILYLWTKGNLQLIPRQTSIPCDGKSTVPIKVQFINAFGKPRKQRKDREVEMETTSGKIQNVIIPAGKEFAEATLTSSTEGGPVTITAKSGKQKATTQVNFVCEEAHIDVDVSSPSIPADGSSTATVTIKVKDAAGKYVTSINERTVELTTTLGTVTSPVTIPPKTLAGIAIVTSGQVSGTAIITASIGSLKGEGKIVFAELPKKYCMHCGAPMVIQSKSCPVCGNVPPSGVDTKQCSTCGAVLPLSAKFCDKCGAKQPI